MRAQSHVVGAALMVGLAVLGIGALTMGIGTILDSQAESADADRVASALDEGLDGVERTGAYSQQVRFSEGTLSTEQRTLRVLYGNGTVHSSHEVGALVYESGDSRVASVAGATVRGPPGAAWLVSGPPITSSEHNEVLVVGVSVLAAGTTTVGGQGGVSARLETNVSHSRTELASGAYGLAIETETPGPFERYFTEQGAATDHEQFEGDRHESVVAQYPGDRSTYLVVHDLSLEVNGG